MPLLGILTLTGVMLLVLGNLQEAQASSSYMSAARTQYPTIVGTSLDSCNLCHTTVPALNAFGNDFKSHAHSFAAIENLDSDKDGYTNIAEINGHSMPGNANSIPGPSVTATPTKLPPTATPTKVPPTATPTKIPPTATPTKVPPTATPTGIPPTITPTQLPPTATPTKMPPTVTPTGIPPTMTPSATPTKTPTQLPPTATPTRLPPTATPTGVQPTATPPATTTPPATHRITITGTITKVPGTSHWIGNWVVHNRTIHVTSQTKITIADGAQVKKGAYAVVKGTRLADGSVNATSISVSTGTGDN